MGKLFIQVLSYVLPLHCLNVNCPRVNILDPPAGGQGKRTVGKIENGYRQVSHFKGDSFILVLEYNYWFIIEFYLLYRIPTNK